MKIFISRDIILSREFSEKVQPWPLNSQQRFTMRCSNIVQRVIVVSALVFSPLAFCYGQVQSAPGGINGASLWSANGDSGGANEPKRGRQPAVSSWQRLLYRRLHLRPLWSLGCPCAKQRRHEYLFA